MCPSAYHHNGIVVIIHDVWLHITGTNKTKSAQQAKQRS